MAFLFLLVLLLGATGGQGNDRPSAYEELQKYNLPAGLLPQGTTGYDLNEDTGKFWAYMNRTCTFGLKKIYELKYRTSISGVISRDRLKKLKGISVKVLKVWLNIVEVRRNGDNLEFSVGVTSASFPVASFAVSPQCGCGFDCPTGNLYLASA